MKGLLRWTVRILCLGLACLLAFLMIRYHSAERAHDAHIAELQAEAEAYEAQLKAIQNELDTMKSAVGGENRTGMLPIAFAVRDAADLEQIGAWASQYAFTPAIVLDVETEHARQLAEVAAREGYEVVLTALPFTADTAERAAALLPKPEEADAEAAPALFLLREAYEDEDNLTLLMNAGFDGCICYYDHKDFSEAHPDFQLMQYSYLKSDSFSVEKRLKQLSDGGEALMFVFDLASADLPQEAVERFLSTISGYAADADLEFTTVSETCLALRQNRMNTMSGQADYETLLAERQAEIDALKEKLDEIYSNWKGEKTA